MRLFSPRQFLRDLHFARIWPGGLPGRVVEEAIRRSRDDWDAEKEKHVGYFIMTAKKALAWWREQRPDVTGGVRTRRHMGLECRLGPVWVRPPGWGGVTVEGPYPTRELGGMRKSHEASGCKCPECRGCPDVGKSVRTHVRVVSTRNPEECPDRPGI